MKGYKSGAKSEREEAEASTGLPGGSWPQPERTGESEPNAEVLSGAVGKLDEGVRTGPDQDRVRRGHRPARSAAIGRNRDAPGNRNPMLRRWQGP